MTLDKIGSTWSTIGIICDDFSKRQLICKNMSFFRRFFTKSRSFSGIALKKVEQREMAKNEEANGPNGTTDVASILARRVAVEMSDSDNENGASDSEYDSDEWGDESNAWHKLNSKSKAEYFFKSQESLATVIDNEDSIEDPESQPEEDHNEAINIATASKTTTNV